MKILTGINNKSGRKIQPVGITFDSQGRIWFTDDKLKQLFVISKNTTPDNSDDTTKDTFEEKNKIIIDNISEQALIDFDVIYKQFKSVETCTQCHDKDNFPLSSKKALLSFLNLRWIQPRKDADDMELFSRMNKEQSSRSMPPPPEEKPFEQDHPLIYKNFKTWVEINI